ncbi:cytochrome P450, partial [Thraustotheca clavata]
MLRPSRLVLVATTFAAVAANQCCFKDGDIITLKSDIGLHLGRCNNCIQREAYVDSAFVHVDDPNNSPWAKWTVVNTGNGKIALQADSGKYLGRCNNCAYWAAYPDEAFVHVSDWRSAPWAQWKCHDVGDGKIALEADSGKYLARCNNCVSGAYPNTGMVRAESSRDSWARWQVAQNGKFF